MTQTNSNPRYDAELLAMLDAETVDPRESFLPHQIEERRAGWLGSDIDQVIAGRPLSHREIMIAGHGGDDIVISVIEHTGRTAAGPGILHPHSGGMIIGTRFSGIDMVADWVERYVGVAVSVEYRLAPEHPDPVPIEDCYAALLYMAENAEELGLDPNRLIVAGMSAGGGLAAGLALLARDRNGPSLAGQLLMCPMLDESNSSASAQQFSGLGLWDRESNDTGWNALLGDRRHTDAVTPYASPSRAVDLAGLPPAFIDVGSMEVFRDEDIDYARRIWAVGGDAELHVWPGAFHGFDLTYPHAVLSRRAIQARVEWLDRIFAA